ncbi:hypothetical protein BDN72DRAFT_846824 [Pluteus cervinus]|uniref:Uncharacterized protein n=1 Tax=Pluteus cervinus TaxID=181527 RepID=A0ACD3AEV4_9AGAR|nr:hypothetical protein BDN72DRAFT_846824 [Pluteus cervinus]
MATFPVKIIENILEHVYSQYKPLETPYNLHQCALVSHTWRAISHSLIFFELLLSEGREERVKALLGAQNGHLRQYVRKAWIEDHKGQEFIEEFLNSLPNVQGLYVLHGGSLKLISMESPVPETTLKNLTSLGLSMVASFPVQAFYSCHSLRELKTNESTFEVDIKIQHSFPGCSPISSLDSLRVTGDELSNMRILEWMLTPQCPFDLRALTTLRIADRSDELRAYEWAAEIVRLCTSTLRDLMIDPPTSLAVEDPQVTTESLLYSSALSNLRVVTISIIQEIKDYTSYIPWMKAFFSCLPVPNRLEEIHIPCLFTHRTPDSEDAHIAADMPLYGWEAFDAILTSSEFRLKRVVFGIYGLGKPSRPEALRSLLRESLPGLNRNGVLEVVGSKEYGYISEEDRWWYIKPVGVL